MPFLQHSTMSPTTILSPSFSFPFYPSPAALSTTTPFLYPYYSPLSSPPTMLPHPLMVQNQLSQFTNGTTYCTSRKNGYLHPELTAIGQKETGNIDIVNCNANDYSECSRHTPMSPPALIPISHIDTPNHLPVIMSSPTKSCSSYSSDRTCTSRHRKLSHP